MKKRLYALVALILAFAFVATPTASAQAASTKGYHTGDGSWAYIMVADKANSSSSYIFHPQGVKKGYITLTEVEGLSYDKKTNTLTMKNFKQPNLSLDINEMGSDFKIKLVGKNAVSSITVWGNSYAGCLELTGSGTLTVNKSKSSYTAFTFEAENSAATFKVGKKVKLYAYAGKESGYSVQIIDSTLSSVSKSLVFNGRKSTKKVEKITDGLYERVEKAVKFEYGYWHDDLYTLSKDGQTYWGFEFPGDYGWEYYICKGIGEEDGIELVEIVEQITDFTDYDYPFTDNGYSYKQVSSVYTYNFKGNLTIK